jgi:hypothetical protein
MIRFHAVYHTARKMKDAPREGQKNSGNQTAVTFEIVVPGGSGGPVSGSNMQILQEMLREWGNFQKKGRDCARPYGMVRSRIQFDCNRYRFPGKHVLVDHFEALVKRGFNGRGFYRVKLFIVEDKPYPLAPGGHLLYFLPA